VVSMRAQNPTARQAPNKRLQRTVSNKVSGHIGQRAATELGR